MGFAWDIIGTIILVLILLAMIKGLNAKPTPPIAYSYYPNKGEILNATIVCQKFNLVVVNNTLDPTLSTRMYAYCYNYNGNVIRVAINPN